MTGAEVTEHDDGFLVICEPHGLARKVETGQHAANLQALHNRVDHADDTDSIEVDLTAAAVALTEAWDGCDNCIGALALWQALVGIRDDEGAALTFARQIAAAPEPIIAAVPPF